MVRSLKRMFAYELLPPRVQKTLQLEGFLIVSTDLKYGGHLRIFI